MTVTELLDPVCSVASLCTSTLAGLKSSVKNVIVISCQVETMLNVAKFVVIKLTILTEF